MYLCKAAGNATQLFAIRTAVALYDQALEIADRLGTTVAPQTLMEIHHAKANLHLILSDFDRSRIEGERLLDLARGTNDRVSEGKALASMAQASTRAHDFDRALTYARQAITVAEQADTRSVWSIATIVGTVYYLTAGSIRREGYASPQDPSSDRRCHASRTHLYDRLLKNWKETTSSITLNLRVYSSLLYKSLLALLVSKLLVTACPDQRATTMRRSQYLKKE